MNTAKMLPTITSILYYIFFLRTFTILRDTGRNPDVAIEAGNRLL